MRHAQWLLLTAVLLLPSGILNATRAAPQDVAKPATPPKAAELIRGRWKPAQRDTKDPQLNWALVCGKQPNDKNVPILFDKTGCLVFLIEGTFRPTAYYKLLDDETLELTDTGVELGPEPTKTPPPPKKLRLKFKVTPTQLTLTDEKGTRETYQRLPPVAAVIKIGGLPFCCDACASGLKAGLKKVPGISDLVVDVKGRTVVFKLRDEEDQDEVTSALDGAGMHGSILLNGTRLLDFEPGGIVLGGKPPELKSEIIIKGVHACCARCEDRIAAVVPGAKVTFEGVQPIRTLRIRGEKLDERKIVNAIWNAGYKVNRRTLNSP